MCFLIVRCAQCDFVQRQMTMSNVTLREEEKEEEEEFERDLVLLVVHTNIG